MNQINRPKSPPSPKQNQRARSAIKTDGFKTHSVEPSAKKPLALKSPESKANSNIYSLKSKRRLANRMKLKLANTRKIALISVITSLLAVAAIVGTLFFAPVFQVQNFKAPVTGYVDSAQIFAVLESTKGQPLITADTARLEEALTNIPGIVEAKVSKEFPNTIRAEVKLGEAVATINSGTESKVVDVRGNILPANAVIEPVPVLTISPNASDPLEVENSLLAAIEAMPPRVRQAIISAEASTISNLTFKFSTEAGVKTVIWGSATDTDLKVAVLEVLLAQPGEIIDLTSPNAPTVR